MHLTQSTTNCHRDAGVAVDHALFKSISLTWGVQNREDMSSTFFKQWERHIIIFWAKGQDIQLQMVIFCIYLKYNLNPKTRWWLSKA